MATPHHGKVLLRMITHALLVGLENVPAVGMAVEIGRGCWQILRDAQEEADQDARIAQLEQAGDCSPAEARDIAAAFIAEQRARGVDIPADKEAALLDLLSATPAAVREHTRDALCRARQRGTAPHTVLPVTAAFSDDDREAFYHSLLPARRPLYHPGDALPHGNPAWKLRELLGSGGFGEVWRVEQARLGEQRAVKFCQDPVSAKVLKREADTLIRLHQHLPELKNAHIVLLRDVQVEYEPYWLSFDYVAGGTLEGAIRAGALSWPEAKALFVPIVRSMAAVHRLDIVHRDLKPANILLDGDTPKITDFGIGKITAEQAGTERRTRTRFTTQGYGSWGYMSPEQEDPRRPAHPADDTYALGVMLWQMLSGSLAFPHYEDDVTALAAPAEVKQLITMCRFRPRDKRPRDAGVMLQWLTEEKKPSPPPKPQPKPQPKPAPQPAPPREKTGSGGAWLVFFVVVLVVGAVWYLQREPESKARTASPSSSHATFTEPESGITFVKIPAGCFQMGSNSGSDDEKPVHEVCVDEFWLGKTEVTQAQWEKVMGSNPSHFKGADRPVEQVSWDNTQTFLRKLGPDYRLPTEAEWEYAARAGSAGDYSRAADGREVTESNLGEFAWYRTNSENQTHPVGEKQANAFGLYDMHGNVWEWCGDWYGGNYYANSTKSNPKGSNSGESRVLRGGSWYDNPENCRAADRNNSSPDNRFNGYGLRVVRSVR